MDNMLLGVVSEDPLSNLAIGTKIEFELIAALISDSKQFPQFVKNWDFFQGALLALVIKTDNEASIFGTAFMVAPGLVLTATHIIADRIDDIKDGKEALYCIGIRKEAADLWKVLEITYNPDDDIALFSVSAASELPSDHKYYRFGITTRTPKNGEEIHLIGFRGHRTYELFGRLCFSADIFSSLGTVTAVYPSGLGKSYIPYPTIEINCGSIGGMSGGIALDKNGLVVGIISKGFDTDDHCGPTHIAWIIKALVKKITLQWPKGLHPTPTSLLTMNEYLAFIDKREALSGSSENELKYKIWFE